MRNFKIQHLLLAAATAAVAGCGSQPAATNGNLTSVNTNANIANSVANSNLAPTANASVETREPDRYQANIRLTLEMMNSGQQNTAIPTIGAMVARNGEDRVMEFNLPTNEKVIYLDKGGMSYLVLPTRRQYAELGKDSLGFDVRRLMMPSEIVNRIKTIPGVRLVGEESMNGRQVVKYAYQSAANTGTQAGTIATESFMLIDKETGLPLRTETVSQSQSGGSVQGISGGRIVTEMTDINSSPDANIFNLPTDFQKIDAEAVKAQVSAVFSVVGNLIGQAINQAKPAAGTNTQTNSATPR
jgi:hypothetical protein